MFLIKRDKAKERTRMFLNKHGSVLKMLTGKPKGKRPLGMSRRT